MNILHISNGYADSKVHSNLTKALDKLGIIQTVYCPVREERLIGKNKFEGNKIKFVYSYSIKPWYKYVYHFKLWMLFRDLKSKVNLKGVDVVHAATLFSDGGLALKVYKQYGVPYIVAVRNTDINLYISKLKHTHRLGREILCNARRIVFISKGEMAEFEESSFIKPIWEKIKDKVIFQPNGIEDFWHTHLSKGRRNGHDVLYIGDYTPNKNVVRLAEAVLALKQEKGFEDIRLIIVGGEKEGMAWKSDGKTQVIIDNNLSVIKAQGKIYDKDRLAEIMRSSALFAMPSIHETFGLVYVEALSQNLPVVYTKGQGIDGLFDSSVGEGVDPLSVDSIKDAIRRILTNPQSYSNASVDFSDFDWTNIAKRYIDLYQSLS